MTALAVDEMPDSDRADDERGSYERVPKWLFPPKEGFKAEDLDHFPELPPHSELIDGSIVIVSPQADFHMLTVSLLEGALRRQLPDDMRVRREMTVTLDEDQRPEPDVLVLRAEGITGRDQTTYDPEHVVLAVEVVSPESARRDRERKPQLYARAGIPHFWRVENADGKPMLLVYELDQVNEKYVATGIYHDHLKLTVPFDIDIDLTEIDRL